ncbi:MAG: DNA modification methylase, partial [Gammaproteobacteria bacterium]|nr:DNA modification methylase [Gammaproteobacteria bacterium]
FKGQRLLTGKHRIHPYPAMMHPKLASFLLARYAKQGAKVLDPFCGSGTVLLTAQEMSLDSTGFDINPLALIIADAKTTNYDSSKLQDDIESFKEYVGGTSEVSVPVIKNIDFWYGESVISELGRMRHVLQNQSFHYPHFLTVVFANVCRTSSYTRNSEFKRYRETIDKRVRAPGSVIDTMFARLDETQSLFNNNVNSPGSVKIQLRNSENEFNTSNHFDIVVTSPPYGDHGTTVAYGQYSSFGNEWTELLNPFNTISYTVDSEGLGKNQPLTIDVEHFPHLRSTLREIEKLRPDRARDITLFFNGYLKVISNVSQSLADAGYVCFVVGNRQVASTEIPLDQITAEIFEYLGLDIVNIHCREITNKVMPLKNSPQNIRGKKSKTMTDEYVVVAQKV